jgi:hypothetical protein
MKIASSRVACSDASQVFLIIIAEILAMLRFERAVRPQSTRAALLHV